MLILQKEEAPEDIQGLARGVSLMRGPPGSPGAATRHTQATPDSRDAQDPGRDGKRAACRLQKLLIAVVKL